MSQDRTSQNHGSPAIDVVIVGAGLAGLRAARRLVDAGLTVRILEARDRVGGRILDHELTDGSVVPVGATWFGPDEVRMPALLEVLGLTTVPQRETGDVIMRILGTERRAAMEGGCIEVGISAMPRDGLPEEFLAAVAELERLCLEVSPEDPHSHPAAVSWDDMTAGQWCDARCSTERGRALLRAAIEEEIWESADDVSFLFVLFIWRSLALGEVDDRRIKGGTAQIPTLLARPLEPLIALECAVHSIHQSADHVAVAAVDKHGEETTLPARLVVVTVPPHLCRDLRFDPPPPAKRATIVDHMRMAKVIRVHLVYDRPFWRDEGLCGFLVTDEGPLGSTFDISFEDGGPAILTGFISGRRAEYWTRRTEDERRAAVIDQVSTIYGPLAASPREYAERDWVAEEWSGGGFTSWLPPGVMAENWPAIREPFGRVHWAGTETARLWYGSMEGALESGDRVAEEILERLETAA